MHSKTAHKLPIRKRGIKWQVDARKIGGKQTTHPTKAQAEGQAQLLWDDHQASQALDFDFTADRRRIAVAAFSELAGYDDTALIEAARFYRENVDVDTVKKSLAEVVKEYLAAMQGNVADSTLKNDYTPSLNKAARGLGEQEIHTIQTTHIEKWLTAEGITKAAAREKYRATLGRVWKFAISRGYARHNAAEGLAKMSRNQRRKQKAIPPAILTAKELQTLLDTAANHRKGFMLPYFAICGLSGIRPERVKKLSWSDINLKDREIYVEASDTKTSDDREVKMCDALADWLELTPPLQRRGKIKWSRFSFDAIRKESGTLARWQEPKGRDILRHSAASHHYRHHGLNAEITAAQMGHDVLTFRMYYKRRVTVEEAKDYFDVRPASTAQPLEISKAG